MCDKANRSLLLNRQRGRKYRVVKRARLDADGEIVLSESEENCTQHIDCMYETSPGEVSVEVHNTLDEQTESIIDQRNVRDIRNEHFCEYNAYDEEENIVSPPVAEELRQWVVECKIQHSKVDLLLKRLKKFHPELPESTKTLLNRRYDVKIRTKKSNSEDEHNPSEFVYIGLESQSQKVVKLNLHPENVIYLQSQVDDSQMNEDTSNDAANSRSIFGMQFDSQSEIQPDDDEINQRKHEISRNTSTQTDFTDIKPSTAPLTKNDLENALKKYFSEIKRCVNDKMTSEIELMENKVGEVKLLTTEKNPFCTIENLVTLNHFINKYNHYEFPIRTREEFDLFLTEVGSDSSTLKVDLKKCLYSTINFSIELSENLTKVVKKLISKDILKDYTPQRLKPGKLVFKETKLYSVLEDSLLEIYNTNLPKDKRIDEKLILSALGVVFNNAKDWQGGRAARFKKEDTKDEKQ
ncbi:uncharacterized protein LOC106640519 [Copidosoma floridanum]|uniref:uncharacterized protein LOC106640519 n=1 Tax=Copidosoma floridanum TaxID=29053 RepID=UPI0006C9CCE9|nr:uncharacterized protein LOC106640519 [Copidosoma floridanum]